MKRLRNLGSRTGRIQHRLRQFIETLTAPLRTVAETEAAVCLVGTSGAVSLEQLFHRMPRAEQRHGLRVCRRLRARGFTAPDLLAAGLLHDAGKIVYPPRLWERVAVVLLEHYLPIVGRWMAHGYMRAFPFSLPGLDLQQAFRVRRCHPCWGAKLAANAGAGERTISLIRRHHSTAWFDDEELAALQDADEA